MLNWLSKLWLKLFQAHAFNEPYFTKIYFCREFPDILKNRVIYVEGDATQHEYWYIGFICPCGCGVEYKLNLISDTRPVWVFEVSTQNQISITPSVWRTDDCHSHFFIKENNIIWVSGGQNKEY